MRNQIFTFRPVQFLPSQEPGADAALCPLTETTPKSIVCSSIGPRGKLNVIVNSGLRAQSIAAIDSSTAIQSGGPSCRCEPAALPGGDRRRTDSPPTWPGDSGSSPGGANSPRHSLMHSCDFSHSSSPQSRPAPTSPFARPLPTSPWLSASPRPHEPPPLVRCSAMRMPDSFDHCALPAPASPPSRLPPAPSPASMSNSNTPLRQHLERRRIARI